MTIVPKKKSDSRSTKTSVGVPKTSANPNNNSNNQNNDVLDENLQHHAHLSHQNDHHDPHQNQPDLHGSRRSPLQCSSSGQLTNHMGDVEDADYSGYNSGDEYSHDRRKTYLQCTEQESQEKEIQFEKKIIKKGWVIRQMAEDGACLFRAVADQIYGDQEMHKVVRKLCIDYIAKNSDYFSQYVTEDFDEYLRRKSLDHSHGNHIEIQAMSEMFNRPIEVYHYTSEPINIFQGPKSENEPIRLSYHKSVHYNSIVNPFKATVGVGLGLPAYEPGLADRDLLEKAIRMSDEDAIEKAMLEDKLLATDWEATNDAIEEQVARESYLEWLRENENRLHKKFKKSTSPQPTTTAGSFHHYQSPSTRFDTYQDQQQQQDEGKFNEHDLQQQQQTDNEQFYSSLSAATSRHEAGHTDTLPSSSSSSIDHPVACCSSSCANNTDDMHHKPGPSSP